MAHLVSEHPLTCHCPCADQPFTALIVPPPSSLALTLVSIWGPWDVAGSEDPGFAARR